MIGYLINSRMQPRPPQALGTRMLVFLTGFRCGFGAFYESVGGVWGHSSYTQVRCFNGPTLNCYRLDARTKKTLTRLRKVIIFADIFLVFNPLFVRTTLLTHFVYPRKRQLLGSSLYALVVYVLHEALMTFFFYHHW